MRWEVQRHSQNSMKLDGSPLRKLFQVPHRHHNSLMRLRMLNNHSIIVGLTNNRPTILKWQMKLACFPISVDRKLHSVLRKWCWKDGEHFSLSLVVSFFLT